MLLVEMKKLIESVYAAHEQGDEEVLFELGTEVMEVYLEALSDVNFGGMKTEWLNEIVSAVDDGNAAELVDVLERENDCEDRFLGSQVAALFAGFRQRDSLITLAQAVGIRALLEDM